MMDNGNWRPAPQGGGVAAGGGGGGVGVGGAGEPTMEAGDWRAQLPQESRQRIVNKIMETLKKHLPVSGPDGLSELKKIAVRFEEKIYTAATSQQDYLRKISLKMLTMETKSQNTIGPNSLPPNAPGSSSKPSEPGLQQQIPNQSQSIPNSLVPNQSQARQQLLSQNIQNNIPSSGVQASSSLSSSMPPVSGLGQNTNMQNMSNVSQNSLGNPMAQMFVNPQRQMPGRPQVVAQQQQAQNSQQYVVQHQLQHQLMKQKLQQQGNMSHSLMSSQIPQPPQQMQQSQQNMLQPNQLQSHQQSLLQTPSVMPPSSMQQASLPGLQPNQQSSLQPSTQSMLQQHIRQQQQSQGVVHQQQSSLSQQPMLTSQQQQQQMVGQQSNMHQSQLMNQQNSMGDMHQPQQRLLSQQNNLQSLQPQQQQPQQQQQQLMPQQNNLPNIHSQQLALQNNVSGLHQQQSLLGSQAGTSSMAAGQHSVHILPQPKVPIQQQMQPSGSNMLPSQGQQSQPQPMQQQMMSQIQSQPAQLQQQVNLQQQSNSYQRDMQQRLQAPGSLLQSQNLMDQQKPLYQSQRSLTEASSMPMDTVGQGGHANGSDWQEEVYQKIKSMKEMYLPEINEMYQKIATKLQQHDSHPQQPKSDQLERLKTFKTMLERIISFLQVSKNDVLPAYKEKLASYERQIINFINTNRPRKNPALQQGQIQQPINPIQQQQAQSQMSQLQSHESQTISQMQSMNMPGPVGAMQQNTMASLQHSSVSPMPGVSNAQQNMITSSLQPNSNMDAAQGNAMNSLQQVTANSMQQNAISAPQQVNVNNMSSQSGANMLQSNISGLQSNPNLLQHQHLKQQQEPQMLQSQQLKQQYQQRQMQQQLMQKQQLLQQQQQQLHQQAKQQLPSQLQTHPMPQLHQMNDVNEMKVRPGMGVKPGVFQQHHAAGQRSTFPQQLKPGASFPISSPQLLQAASPQIPQHSSPQIDQQNLLSSLTKTGTPLQSASSPFVVPSPATPAAPSPMPVDSEKPISGVTSLANSGNLGGHQQTAVAPASAPAPSLAIGTPGISASPLLAEFSSPDAAHGNASAAQIGKSSATEQPIERLIKAVKSMSSQALTSAVSDIGSVVSMVDRIAGSAPGNGSRAAVGEDLVAMTKCRLQARNFAAPDGTNGNRKMRRYTSAMPLNVASSASSVNDSFKQLNGAETSELESTASSSIKRPRVEANHALLEEIREINYRLIDTVVDISKEENDPSAAAAANEGGEGVIVKCSYNAVSLSPSLKSQYTSTQMSPIQPLRLLVPVNYPNCSPVLLDKFPVEVSKEYEDLSTKAKLQFSISLRSLSRPMSLKDIAKTWDNCARNVILEYAQQRGGGSFSSKYGTWENCLSAA